MTNDLQDYSGAGAVTPATPDKILFGAGSYHENVAISEDGEVTSLGTFIGCTNGGGKFSIVPTIATIEVDQSTVAREGFDVKQGEEASIETNVTELGADFLAKALVADKVSKTSYEVISSRETISTSDYYENFAFVGRTASGKPVIVLFEKAICTSGLEVESKKGEQSTPTVVFKCVAALDSGKNVLPWHIYWPKDASAPQPASQKTRNGGAE